MYNKSRVKYKNILKKLTLGTFSLNRTLYLVRQLCEGIYICIAVVQSSYHWRKESTFRHGRNNAVERLLILLLLPPEYLVRTR